jgi:uncharacterized membrane protein YcaP (DUF421 family)
LESIQSYLAIVFSTAVVYLFILVALRVFGKTEIAQLTIVDLVFILLISNAVQNAMVGPDSSLAGGLVAATTLFVMNYLLKRCLYRVPWLGRLIQGSPLTLIRHGQVDARNLARAMLTTDDLMEALREHGVDNAANVDMAVLEMDGNISVLSDKFKTSAKRSRLSRRQTKKSS